MYLRDRFGPISRLRRRRSLSYCDWCGNDRESDRQPGAQLPTAFGSLHVLLAARADATTLTLRHGSSWL
jgi:hypothetical protein